MTYKIQIDDQVRNATPDEIASIDEWHAEAARLDAELEQQRANIAAAKASASTKLKALGLTDDEIAALIP